MKRNKIGDILGENIRTIREIERLTQTEFAQKLNIILKKDFNINGKYESKTISNWEQGKSIPRMDVLVAIAKHYNLSLDHLFKDLKDETIKKFSLHSLGDDLLDEFLKYEEVCVLKNDRYVSGWNPDLYQYGQLSYLADNLISYEFSLSRNFKITSPAKQISAIVGILDVNDGKRELHYLGNGIDDIVSIEKFPACYSYQTSSKNNLLGEILYNELMNVDMYYVIKLGNGKTFVINSHDDFDRKTYKFDKSDIPPDEFEKYCLDDDMDFFDYACIKSHNILNEDLFKFYCDGYYYCKSAGVIVFVVDGEIKVDDSQLLKVLSNDYEYRLVYKWNEAQLQYLIEIGEIGEILPVFKPLEFDNFRKQDTAKHCAILREALEELLREKE